MAALARYHWPGNIRELQNVIERAVILSRDPLLTVPLVDLTYDLDIKQSPGNHECLQDFLHETERTQILRALEQANGVIGGPNGAAARLRVKRTTLQSRIHKLGIRLLKCAETATQCA
jgi:formate hydrogenlyase transcriptional activator